MDTNKMELKLNEMEAINGGFNFKRFISNFDMEDAFIAVLGGPVGQTLILGKAAAAVAAEITLDD